MYIYIITEAGHDSPCKIGYARNPQKRASDLSVGNPNDLVVRYAEECVLAEPSHDDYLITRRAIETEKTIHKSLKYSKIRREWFDIDWQRAMPLVHLHIYDAKTTYSA